MRARSWLATTISWRMKSGIVTARRNERSTPWSSRARKPESASAVSRRVLLGSVPVLATAPPSSGLFSTSATRLPKNAAVSAPFSPAGPEPMTIRSYGVGSMHQSLRLRSDDRQPALTAGRERARYEQPPTARCSNAPRREGRRSRRRASRARAHEAQRPACAADAHAAAECELEPVRLDAVAEHDAALVHLAGHLQRRRV